MHHLIGTYSIAARDSNTGELAIGVQSRLLAVGSVVPTAAAETGAVITQAWANVAAGSDALALLQQGVPAAEVVERLISSDEACEQRQLAVVDSSGAGAAHTGTKCIEWAGHVIGQGYVCIGNLLPGDAPIKEMAAQFEAGDGLPHLTDRVMAALAAAERATRDAGLRRAAALLVVRKGGGYGGTSDRLVDLRVDDHPDPLSELNRLLELHRQLWLKPTPPEHYLLDSDEKIVMLQTMLRELGVFDGAVNGELTYNTRGSLAAYCAEHSLPGLDASDQWIPGITVLALREAVTKARRIK